MVVRQFTDVVGAVLSEIRIGNLHGNDSTWYYIESCRHINLSLTLQLSIITVLPICYRSKDCKVAENYLVLAPVIQASRHFTMSSRQTSLLQMVVAPSNSTSSIHAASLPCRH